jgi:DNA-binding transcriptional regulator YiaG
MNDGSWLRRQLAGLAITPAELATLLEVTPRAVAQWLTDRRRISGPAVAYIQMLRRIPREYRIAELCRLRGW